MNYTSVESSNVEAIGYDDNTSTLGVRFLNGTEYEYYSVPRNVYDSFLNAPSMGKYLNEKVKRAGYSYRQTR